MRRRSIWSFEMMRAREFSRNQAIREANKAFKVREPQTPTTDYAKAQQTFQENRERLKAQRLAREAKAAENRRDEVFLDV
jgi:hypothetical protein